MLPSVLGVTIHGTVYDIGLDRLPNTIVVINSTPEQQMVSKNGTFSFSVPPGLYELKAWNDKSESVVAENITASSEGDYVFDLILLPSLETEEALLEEEFDVPGLEEVIEEKPPTQWALWLVVFIVLGWLVYKMSKKPKRIVEKVIEKVKEVSRVAVSDDLHKILDFIDNEGGRTTQKDIRRQFPYSEAKISLMIDELETKGLIKKIKKGRGNVILKA